MLVLLQESDLKYSQLQILESATPELKPPRDPCSNPDDCVILGIKTSLIWPEYGLSLSINVCPINFN